jgi:hypothetical protein
MFVGPSGCGKTTSLKMINRLIEPTSGTITIDGKDVRKQKVDDLRRHIGYVIQGGSLFPHMTVSQNIALVPKLLGWESKKVDSPASTSCLDLVGLDAGRYRERYPRRAVRWSAAARRGGPRPRRRPAGRAHGRAVRCRRPDHPPAPPGRAAPHPGRAAQDHRLRDPRHRRGGEARATAS